MKNIKRKTKAIRKNIHFNKELYRLFLFYKALIKYLDTFFDSHWPELRSTEIISGFNELYIVLCHWIEQIILKGNLEEIAGSECRPYIGLLSLPPDSADEWHRDVRPGCGKILEEIQKNFIMRGEKKYKLRKLDEEFLKGIRQDRKFMEQGKLWYLPFKEQDRERRSRLETKQRTDIHASQSTTLTGGSEGEKQGSPKKSAEVSSMAKFPTPSDVSWGDVEIKFRDGHTVSITVGNERGIYDFGQMGMASKQNRNPTVLWDLLRTFADKSGTLTWADSAADRKNKKRKQRLSKILREFFGLAGDPFILLEKRRGWQTRFQITPD